MPLHVNDKRFVTFIYIFGLPSNFTIRNTTIVSHYGVNEISKSVVQCTQRIHKENVVLRTSSDRFQTLLP